MSSMAGSGTAPERASHTAIEPGTAEPRTAAVQARTGLRTVAVRRARLVMWEVVAGAIARPDRLKNPSHTSKAVRSIPDGLFG